MTNDLILFALKDLRDAKEYLESSVGIELPSIDSAARNLVAALDEHHMSQFERSFKDDCEIYFEEVE